MDITYKVIIVVSAVLIFLIVKGIYDEHNYKKRLYTRLKNSWGRPVREEYPHELMKVIEYYYRQNNSEGDIDDITYNDLNMDTIYKRVNCTLTSIGDEYFYALLRKPVTDIKELEERERIINIFEENEEFRIKLQIALARMGKVNKISVYQYFQSIHDMEGENKLYHIACALALVISGILCFIQPASMVLVLIAVIIFNVLTYYKSKAKLYSYIQVFAFIVRIAGQSEEIAEVEACGLEEYMERLTACTRKFKKFGRNSWLVSGGGMSGDLFDSILDYVRILFHIDHIKICTMINEIKKYDKELMEMYDIIGYIDSMISAASYRAGLENWCVPKLNEYKDCIGGMEFEDLCHPLIAEPVGNSISVKRSILLTGSNASGKSTFIKTVAINAIFAQTIHTVLAQNYKSCCYHIYSSMALKDDILSSESYYIVEIKSLKRILDNIKTSKVPIICFIDEVLRGTNTLERIAASSQILKHIAKSGAMCFAATHDLELTGILEDTFDNYHFSEKVTEGDVIFDYKLRNGSTKTRNAIKLLDVTGYDKEITRKAEEAAQYFLEYGKW